MPVAGRTGAWKVDTTAIERVGGDATLKRCIKKAFVLYDSTQLPDSSDASTASPSVASSAAVPAPSAAAGEAASAPTEVTDEGSREKGVALTEQLQSSQI